MLNCREITERTSDYLDAALPWPVRLQVRMHLLMCRFCREYVRQMQLLRETLRRLPGAEPPATIDDDLLTAFRAERR